MARWAVAMVVAMLTAVLCLSAQQPATNSPEQDCSRQTIPLTVLKSVGSPWDWHSLNLTVAGRQVPIQSMSATTQPPRVLVLVDTSGSMASHFGGGGRPNWGVGLRTAAFAVDATPLDSSVSLGTFNERDKFGQFESRQAAAKDLVALAQEEPRHRTALYDALKDAATQFQPAEFGDTIFLVTDGGNNHSVELQKRVQQELMARGIRVFVFLVTDKDFKTQEEREAPDDMWEVANVTGGALVQADWSKQWVASDEAKKMVQQIRTMVRWPYQLQFKLDQPLQKPGKLKITPPDKRSLDLSYPHEVLPCLALAAKSH